MASEKSVLAVIRAARPTFRNQNDKIAFVVHSSFLASGYVLTATGLQALYEKACSDPSNDEVFVDHWNELNDVYAFVYANPEKGSEKVLVKCLMINEKLLVHTLSPGSSVEFICSVGDYAGEYGGNNYSQHFKNLDKLVKKINEDVLSKLDGSANATSSRRQMKKRKNAHVQDLSSGPQAPKKLRTHSRRVVGQSSNQVQTEDNLSQGPQPCKKLRRRSRGYVRKSSKLPQHAQSTSDQSQEDGGRVIQSLNRAAATSTSKVPSFTILLKHSYVMGYTMILPAVFIKEHLKENEGDEFLLRVSNRRSWQVKFKNGKFSKGWKKFILDNHLNVGDVCLFELIKDRMSFKVTIVRVKGDGDLQRISKLKCIADVPIQAMQEAETFKSRHPFFKVIIKASKEEDYRPRLPLAFKRKYFPEKHIVILRYANKSWEIHLACKVQTKLSKGWVQFAKESNLQAGDVCIFELIDKVSLVFDVHIFRG